MGTNPLLSVNQLGVEFYTDQGLWVPAIRDVSFSVAEGSVTALVGESGSGKSVSSLAIMDLLPDRVSRVNPRSEILFEGQNLLALPRQERRRLSGRRLAMVFQEPMTSLNPVMCIGDQIVEMIRLHSDINRSAAFDKARQLLEEVGLPDPGARLRYYPHQLSGGQQQRVMIAMAIACEPRLLIADEPTTALDVTIQAQILELLASLRERHAMALLFITHDLAVVSDIADSIVVMRDGQVRESGSKIQVMTAPQDPYTQALLACRPPVVGRPKRLPQVDDFMTGTPPPIEESPVRDFSGAPVLLEVTQLSKHFESSISLFRRRRFTAVNSVSLSIRRGETLGVVGESGSGKTTLGLTLMRLHEPDQGQVLFDGIDVFHAKDSERQALFRRMQIVFQNPYASLNPRFTIAEILMEPMRVQGVGGDRADQLARAQALLEQVGLPPAALSRYPHEFSGGQRQRIAIARCLTLSPELLVLDESVSALDVSVQAQVLNLLKSLQERLGLSYLFISHDLNVVRYMSDRIMVMQGGEVVEEGDADDLFNGGGATPVHPRIIPSDSGLPNPSSRCLKVRGLPQVRH